MYLVSEKMFTDLSMAQVNCSLIADVESGYYINEVDCILTGAEVVLDDGSIINRKNRIIILTYYNKFYYETFHCQKRKNIFKELKRTALFGMYSETK